MVTAEAVVIGGGVNGASALFHLAQAGVRDVVLVEQGHLAAGATGKSGALVRMHYTNPAETRLAHESLAIFRGWGEIVGGSCGYTPTGFVQVVAPEHEAELRAHVAMQRAIGADAQIISAAELRELEPGCRTDDLTYVAYEPGSGYADPISSTYSAVASAEVVDDCTVKVIFKAPNPAWLLPFVGTAGLIIPEHLFKDYIGDGLRDALDPQLRGR